MKLSITQMVLGALIVFLACFIIPWMLHGVHELLDDQYYNENHVLVQNYTPHNEVLFFIARYASVLLGVLGLSVLINGVLWWKVKDKDKLAMRNIIAGSLLVLISAFVVWQGFSFDYIVALKGVLSNVYNKQFTIYIVMLGLAVLVLGIMQWSIAKRAPNNYIQEIEGKER
jgi:hypothetical protein